MALTVNGSDQPLPVPATLPALLAAFGFAPGTVVVEVNGVALTPGETVRATLHDGDTVEIVRAVAGG